MSQHKKALFCFTNDLRLADNPALKSVLERADSLALVYIFNPQEFIAKRYHQPSLGKFRLSFIIQSLFNLQRQLQVNGLQLQILYGDPFNVLSTLIAEQNFSLVGYNRYADHDVQACWRRLERQCQQAATTTEVEFVSSWGNNLFSEQQIYSLGEFFNSFSQFRRQLERSLLTVDVPQDIWPAVLPQSIALSDLSTQFKVSHSWLLENTKNITLQLDQSSLLKPGEQAAQAHLTQYFLTALPHSYKATRNALDGFDTSTKFSPYLAHGNLSARQIWSALKHFELEQGASESSYWIGFELLWREYFHWLAQRMGKVLFQFKGLATTAPLTSYFPECFHQWCNGCTPYPLVNACMKQLNATGYMSNRARQIVASCFVNELGLDWRYGAAYFEQQLVDYDVASNWGNWQYIAGVGADPRGGRHFNLQKQTEIYDPAGEFIAYWQGEQDCSQVLDSVDASDWYSN